MRSHQVNALIDYFLMGAAQFAIFAKILEEFGFFVMPKSLISISAISRENVNINSKNIFKYF